MSGKAKAKTKASDCKVNAKAVGFKAKVKAKNLGLKAKAKHQCKQFDSGGFAVNLVSRRGCYILSLMDRRRK